jgi:hypothetical protein
MMAWLEFVASGRGGHEFGQRKRQAAEGVLALVNG